MIAADPDIRRAMTPSRSPQQTAGWYQARTGVVTCSRLNDVMARLKGGQPAKCRDDYLAEKIVERITGDMADHFTTAAMQRGIDLEPAAISLYEARRGVQVKSVGLIPHKAIPFFAGSPDGFVGNDGMIEVKTCAAREKYLRIVMSRDYEEYLNQIQGNLACNGRAWCDLIVYDDRFPPTQGLHIARIQRDEERIARIETAVRAFLAELDDMTQQAELALGGDCT